MFQLRARSLVITLLVIGFLVFPIASLQAEEKDFYIGVAGNYHLLNMDDAFNVDWDSYALGVNAKFGYRLAYTLYLQIDADYIPKVEGTYNGVDGEGKVLSGMLSLKGYFPVATRLKPFVIVGAGFLHYNIDDPDIENDRETDFCAKIGGGLDLYFNEYVSIGLEANYTAGLEDVEDVEYFNFSLGAAIHF